MISLDNISKKFDSRGIAGIHGLSFELKSGEVMAIMGPNGSGKSTLLNIITKKTRPDSGKVKVDGEVRFFEDQEKDSSINVQKYLVNKITLEMDDEKKIQAARDLADIFEFTFQLRQKIGELSTGQRQKVLLTAELINRPALLLLDEPFTHLDPHTRKEILKSLFTYIRRHETSVLWVTHDLEDALRFSDSVGILNFGKFEQLATPCKLVTAPKNLFVANFLGFENFIPVKKSEKGWMTPWGLLKFEKLSDKDKALLIIPVEAIMIHSEGVPVILIEEYLKGLERRLRLAWEDKNLVARVNYYSELPSPGTSLKIKVKLDECLLIPL